jgi:RNA polymerase sigma-70 factor (ECF subfamily)
LLKVLTARWQRGPADMQDARVLGLRAGHPAVIEDVLLELSPRIRGWCYCRVGPRAALDDIVQEVLIELAGALPRFDGQSSLSTYAYRICTRVVWRQMKKVRGAESLSWVAVESQDAMRDPERASIERQALDTILACLDRLPERRREAFILCELEGESPEQAARMLGTTPNAVRSRLMHARHELQRRLSCHDVANVLRGAR